jgi:hypothetical protein
MLTKYMQSALLNEDKIVIPDVTNFLRMSVNQAVYNANSTASSKSYEKIETL